MFKHFFRFILILTLFLLVTCNHYQADLYVNQNINNLIQHTLNSIDIIEREIYSDYIYLPKRVNNQNIEWINPSNQLVLNRRGEIFRDPEEERELYVSIDALCEIKGISGYKTFNFVIKPERTRILKINCIDYEMDFFRIEPGDIHGVRLTRGYYILKEPVREDLYNRVMGIGNGDDSYKSGISWIEAVEFADRVSILTGREVTLPGEFQLALGYRDDLLLKEFREWTNDAYRDVPPGSENPVNRVSILDEVVSLDPANPGERINREQDFKSDYLGFRLVIN